MRLAQPSDDFTPREPRMKLSYYNERFAAELWSVIQHWRANSYPRTAWSHIDTGEKESTLKAKLYNALRYLNECGTPEQREVCGTVTFLKVGHEYVLTIRRVGRASLAKARVSASQPTPREAERVDGVFAEIRRDIIRFVTETQYDGSESSRPVYERVGVSINEAQRDELMNIIDGPGTFAGKIVTGYNGSVRCIPLSAEEVTGFKLMS